MLSRTLFPVLAATATTGACQDAPHVAPDGETQVAVTTIAKGLDHPWSLAFLPDGRMLVRNVRNFFIFPDGHFGATLLELVSPTASPISRMLGG